MARPKSRLDLAAGPQFRAELARLERRIARLLDVASGRVQARYVRVRSYSVAAHTVGTHRRLIITRSKKANG